MIPFNLLSQTDSIKASKQDYAIIAINRVQGIEVLRVLDEVDLLSWENLELERLNAAQQEQLQLNSIAFDQYANSALLQDAEITGLKEIVDEYRNDYADVSVALEKKKRQSQRKTWIIIGVGVLGLIVGVTITK